MVYLPRIRIETQEDITLTTPGGPAVIALMGTAQWGAMNEVKTFTSFANLLDYYKADKEGLTLVKGSDIAYNNGAYVVKAVRIGHTGYAKAEKAFDSGAETGVLTFKGLYDGTYGNNILVTIITKGTGRIVKITDGVVVENFTNNNDPNGYTTNQDIANAINGVSSLVTVEVKAGSETTNLVDAITETALTGGNDGVDGLVFSDYTTAFDNVLNLEDFDILLTPGIDSDSDHSTMVGKLNTRASNEKKYSLYFTGVSKDEDIATQKARTASGERLVLCSPSIKYTPSYQSTQLILDGSYLACAVAGQVAKRDVEVAVTRKEINVEGLVVDSTTNQLYYNNGEMEELLGAGILPCSLINGALKVGRGVTRVSDKSSIYYEINIQRIVDKIKDQTQKELDGFLGDPNLKRVRDTMAREVDGILQQNKLDEVIVDYKPTEINVGSSPDTIIVSMWIQPTFAINFINVTLAISRA